MSLIKIAEDFKNANPNYAGGIEAIAGKSMSDGRREGIYGMARSHHLFRR